ncbi:hypothetical protein GE061_008538 [Apolygus lucorum]|uniref:Uncharacterized protein n=1 Tax=Apolygus lucorum TaxID=248454 RepID=A0A8S9WMP4_APOLU|nr:hypothetical protein GE061_008538 [Apolygus lucorum]
MADFLTRRMTKGVRHRSPSTKGLCRFVELTALKCCEIPVEKNEKNNRQRRRFEFFSYQRQDDMSIEDVAEKLELLASEGGWGKRTEAVLIMKFCTMFPAHIANELAVLDGMSASFQDYVAAAIRAQDAQFLLPEDNSPNRNLRTLTELAASISSDKGGRIKQESYRSPRKKVKIEKLSEEGVVEEEVVHDLMERDNLSDDLDYDIIDEEPSPSGSPIHEEVITDVSKARRTQGTLYSNTP